MDAPTTSRATDPRARTRRALLWSVAITLVLWIIPFGHWVGYPLYLLSTLVHELGHGLTALLLGGEFLRLEVASDGSGVAFTAVGGDVRRALVAAGGLVGPAVAAFLGFLFGRRAVTARLALLAIAMLTLFATAVWVRSWVGVLIALLVAATCGAAAFAPARRAGMPQVVLVFLSVQLALSVFSRGEYLFTQLSTRTGGAALSDSEAIAAVLFGNHLFWGAVCGLVSVVALLAGARLLLGAMLPPVVAGDGGRQLP